MNPALGERLHALTRARITPSALNNGYLLTACSHVNDVDGRIASSQGVFNLLAVDANRVVQYG